jgi:TatA/E family protein of Tat protein translocase
MGSVGFQEMGFIFLLALLLFGPKKLPELGRMFGKALTEFRRAQSELKATFEREMKSLDRENESTKEIASGYQFENSSYDYSSYDSGMYGDQYHQSTSGSYDSTVTNTPTISASATEGAESQSAATPEGAIAHGAETAAAPNDSALHEGARSESAANGIPAAEHSA